MEKDLTRQLLGIGNLICADISRLEHGEGSRVLVQTWCLSEERRLNGGASCMGFGLKPDIKCLLTYCCHCCSQLARSLMQWPFDKYWGLNKNENELRVKYSAHQYRLVLTVHRMKHTSQQRRSRSCFGGSVDRVRRSPVAHGGHKRRHRIRRQTLFLLTRERGPHADPYHSSTNMPQLLS
jgi:hypothetical protein